jgi:hypothetical protein
MHEIASDKNPPGAGAARLPNGAGAAALLAAGVASFALGALAVLADKSAAMKSAMIFWKPTGPLSGVTTTAIGLWLVAWLIFHWRWRGRNVALRPVSTIAFLLLALGFLLTFPPVGDLL